MLIDQALNHTSAAHKWFLDSIHRQYGRDEWYVWRDPKPDGSAPNKWLS